MKAFILREPFKLERADVAEPKGPGPGQVLLAVKVIGICGSDLMGYQGKLSLMSYPRIMGHEFSGVIEAVGRDVSAVAPGDRVAVEPLISCGRCGPCLGGDYNVCETMQVMGVHVDGAHQERFLVRADRVHKLPDGLDLEEGALIEPLCVALEGTRRGLLTTEDRVAIFGAGSIGLCVLKAAQAYRVRETMVIDVLDERLEAAREMGATHTINAAKEDVPKRVANLTGGKGASAVVEASGAEEALRLAFIVAAYRARVSVIGYYKSPLVEINPVPIVKQELDVYGSRLYRNRFPLAISLVEKREVNLLDLVSHRFSFDDLPQAIATAMNLEKQPLKVLVRIGE